MKYIKAGIAVLLLVLLDQWTKVLAVRHLMNTDGITLIPKVFRLYYLENRGSAFGLMQNQKVFLVFFTVIILAVLTFFYRKIPDTGRMMSLKIAAVLIYAGAIGNFIDRIRQSYVVDFFYFELIDFPVFNVADIYVTTAAIALIILVIFYYKDEDFDKIMDLNVKALYSCTRAAAEIMQETGGSIINTSSIVSFNGQASGCGYPASKFAVNGLTKSLSRELGKYGIRVNAVAPGVTRTDMVAVLPDEMIQPIIRNIPMGRMAEPEDIANAFLFLASDLSSYISGAILPVAGAVVI